jgi:uncharacterized protein
MGGRGSGPQRDPKRDAKMSALRRKGWTLAAIGARFGLTRQAVKVALDRLGVPRPAPRRPVGFARLTPPRRRELAVQGGQAAQAKGTGHRFTADEARAGGRKGGRPRGGERGGRCSSTGRQVAASSAGCRSWTARPAMCTRTLTAGNG